jgi:O-antigen ligase
MPAELAILLCCFVVAILFYLDRDKSVRNSRALWIPVIWLCLIGSRPVSGWFGTDDPPSIPSQNLDGSPESVAVFSVLIAMGVIVLVARRKKAGSYLAVIIPVIVYLVFCLFSVTWSSVPLFSLKQWVKDVGDVVMVLVIVTDTQPYVALRRLFSRVGFILFPLSAVLIRYTSLGRAWNNDGAMSFVGVTTNKNMFGAILFVISLGVLWNFRWLLMNKDEPSRGRRLVAQGILLVLGIGLLGMANSSTSNVCFLLGSVLMLATHLRAIRYRRFRVHMLVLAIFSFGGLAISFGGAGGIANALNRDASLSGRTDIWAALIPTVSSPMIGTGFDSYWRSPNVLIFQRTLNSQGWYHPEGLNEAHNGYLEVYLNLGWVGLCLIIGILTTGYLRAYKAFGRDHEIGSLTLAYIIAGMFYNITEAGFRTLSLNWNFILLAVIIASGFNAGLFAGGTTISRVVSRAKARLVPLPIQ